MGIDGRWVDGGLWQVIVVYFMLINMFLALIIGAFDLPSIKPIDYEWPWIDDDYKLRCPFDTACTQHHANRREKASTTRGSSFIVVVSPPIIKRH